MKTSGNTILITGGTSGIGLALASAFMSRGNRVIITGRDQPLLDAVQAKHPGIRAIQSDVGDPDAIAQLCREIVEEFPSLNVLINNAGIMRKVDLLRPGANVCELASEVEINLVGTIEMVVQFVSHLVKQRSAAIINVSSGLAFVPLPSAPVYCATKAAIHSFTQSLRVQLKHTSVAVCELAPPITRTSLFHGDFSIDEIGVPPMEVNTVVRYALDGLEKGRLEIRPGLSNLLNLMSRIAPGFMLNRLSRRVDRMLAPASSLS